MFKASPFFGRWDPAVLDAYVEFATHDAPNGSGIQLKMSGFNEAATFAEDKLPFEVWELLPTLDKRIALHWVMPEEGPLISGSHDAVRDMVWRRRNNTSNVKLLKVGHLITQEAPKRLADEVNNFLTKIYGGTGKARL